MNVRAEYVFSDDLRWENNGKLILIGVYPEDLIPGAVPSTYHLSVWCRLYEMPAGQHTIVARLTLDENLVQEVLMPVEVNDAGRMLQIALGGIPVHVTKPGVLRVSLSCASVEKFDDGVLHIREAKPLPGQPQATPSE